MNAIFGATAAAQGRDTSRKKTSAFPGASSSSNSASNVSSSDNNRVSADFREPSGGIPTESNQGSGGGLDAIFGATAAEQDSKKRRF